MANESEIAQLESLLNTAAQSVSVDGIQASFNLKAAQQRLAELKRQAAEATWPAAATIKLSSGFSE